MNLIKLTIEINLIFILIEYLIKLKISIKILLILVL